VKQGDGKEQRQFSASPTHRGAKSKMMGEGGDSGGGEGGGREGAREQTVQHAAR
jgi:hypothetical protein